MHRDKGEIFQQRKANAFFPGKHNVVKKMNAFLEEKTTISSEMLATIIKITTIIKIILIKLYEYKIEKL